MIKLSRARTASKVIIGIGFIASGAYTLYALRQNNLEMQKLHTAVIEADKSGQDVYDKLADLQLYIARHMNTNPPKLGTNASVQLVNTYQRDKQAEAERVSTARTTIANAATEYCESELRSARLTDRASCVAQYVAERPVVERAVVADLYRYDFTSPRWTPDTAGWSLVATVSIGIFITLWAFSSFVSAVIVRRKI